MADIISKDKLLYLVAGLFILVGTIGVNYLISNPDLTYYCPDLNIVGMCNKLGACNGDICTRCYFNVTNPYSYKYCKAGWIKYEQANVIGEPTNMPTYLEVLPFDIKKDFTAKADAETYITSLKSNKKMDVLLLASEQRPFSNEIEVFWKVRVYEEYNEIVVDCIELECFDVLKIKQNVIVEEILTTKFNENVGDDIINQTIQLNAQEWLIRWKPDIVIKI